MRQYILIVDDEDLSRELLKQMFEQDYQIIEAKDGKEAILQIDKHADDIAVVLLDLVMPGLDGYKVLQTFNAKGILDKIPFVLITANSSPEIEISCYALGAAAIINKPYVTQTVREHVMNVIEVYSKKEELALTVEQQREALMEQQRRLEIFYDNLTDAIANIVEFRDLESGMHVKRVKGLTEIMARAYMRMYPDCGLTREKIRVIVKAALHDLGKIAIPDSILLKPGRLTDEERRIMMSHTTKGCELLNSLGDVQDEEQYRASYDICRHHHERYDGGGYPDGLKGDDIPLSAQLVSLVDVYDALVCERVYKKPFDKETAYQMIVEGQCGVFSPKLLNCFECCRNALEAFSDSHQ